MRPEGVPSTMPTARTERPCLFWLSSARPCLRRVLPSLKFHMVGVEYPRQGRGYLLFVGCAVMSTG